MKSARRASFAAALPGAAGRLVRLGDVLGADFRANAISIHAEREGVTVEGFAALPTLTRANSLGQYLFVNGRAVRDKLLIGAVRAAYADYLPRDRHPLVALFVTLPGREVDVNVHPAKAEVRFRDAGLVRALIVHALKSALAREGKSAATTGGAGVLAALRPQPDFGAVRPSWPRSLGFAERTQASFDVGAPAANASLVGRRRFRFGGKRIRGSERRWPRSSAGGGARAGARNLHCGADARRPYHRRSARRA